jgi:hypothetical protein
MEDAMGEIERLALRVLRRDKEALRRLAAAEGEAMSVIVRRLIRREAQRRGLLPPGDVQAQAQAPTTEAKNEDV